MVAASIVEAEGGNSYDAGALTTSFCDVKNDQGPCLRLALGRNPMALFSPLIFGSWSAFARAPVPSSTIRAV